FDAREHRVFAAAIQALPGAVVEEADDAHVRVDVAFQPPRELEAGGIHSREYRALGRPFQGAPPPHRSAPEEVAAELAPRRDPGPGDQGVAIEVMHIAADATEAVQQPGEREPARDDAHDDASAPL